MYWLYWLHLSLYCPLSSVSISISQRFFSKLVIFLFLSLTGDNWHLYLFLSMWSMVCDVLAVSLKILSLMQLISLGFFLFLGLCYCFILFCSIFYYFCWHDYIIITWHLLCFFDFTVPLVCNIHYCVNTHTGLCM